MGFSAMTTIRLTSEDGASLNLKLLEQSEAEYESGDVLAVDRSRTRRFSAAASILTTTNGEVVAAAASVILQTNHPQSPIDAIKFASARRMTVTLDDALPNHRHHNFGDDDHHKNRQQHNGDLIPAK
jgi:hypothetical protein